MLVLSGMAGRPRLSALAVLNEPGGAATIRSMNDHAPERVRERWKTSLRERAAARPLTILVLGPNMDQSPLSDAARLRQAIYQRCSEYGDAVMGELKDLIEDARQELGDSYDLCVHEDMLAGDSDVVVIIPEGAGALVELGLFALNENVCAKSVVLLSKSHPRNEGFVNLGAAPAYRNRNARVLRVDYSEIEEVWQLVREELQRRRVMKLTARDAGT